MYKTNLLRIVLVIALATAILLTTFGTTFAQGNTICGWIDVPPTQQPGFGGGGNPEMKVWGENRFITIWPMAPESAQQFNNIPLPGYVRFYDPTYVGNDMIDGFSYVEIVPSCEPETPTLEPPTAVPPTEIPPTPIPPTDVPPTPIPPTDVPIPVVPAKPQEIKLVVTNFKIEPAQPVSFEKVTITLTIENQGGAPFNEPYWNYSGQIILKDASGNLIEERSFAKNDSSDISITDTKPPLIWTISISTYFWHPGNGNTLEVFIQPDNQSISQFVTIQTISIQTNTSEVGKCSAFIAKTILSTLPRGNVKAIGDGLVQGWKEVTCTDVSCKAQVIGKSLIKYSSDAGRVIMSLVGVFDLDGAKECAVRWIWVQEIVKELTRQGVYINMIGVHSPAVVWVTNPDGKKAGFLTDGQLVSDIQDSYAVVEGESKFILLPASDQVTTSFEGTGNGVMTIGIINNPSALGKELTYQNVPVLPGTKAQIDNSDSKFSLKLDTNGDGNVDESRLPDKIDAITNSTTSSANATPTKNIPNSICTGLFGVMILPGGALLRLIQKKKNKK